MTKYKLISIFITAFLLSPLAYAKSELVDRIVATVSGDIILFSELNEAEAKSLQELKVAGKDKDIGTPKSFKRQVLEQLINERLITQEIAKRGLEASDKDVEGAIAEIMKQNGFTSHDQLRQALQSEGLSMEDYRANLKKQMNKSRFMNFYIRPTVAVSDQDFQQYLKAQSAKETGEKEVELYMLFLKKSKSNHIRIKEFRRQISSGKRLFESVAKRETQGPGKKLGGLIGFVNPGQLQPEISQALEKLEPKELSPIIETPQGYYLVRYTASRNKNVELDEEKKKALREQMQQQEMARAFDRHIRKLRDQARIRINL